MAKIMSLSDRCSDTKEFDEQDDGGVAAHSSNEL